MNLSGGNSNLISRMRIQSLAAVAAAVPKTCHFLKANSVILMKFAGVGTNRRSRIG